MHIQDIINSLNLSSYPSIQAYNQEASLDWVRDTSWLAKEKELQECLADNALIAIGIINTTDLTIEEKINKLNCTKLDIFAQANEENSLNTKRIYAILFNYYNIFESLFLGFVDKNINIKELAVELYNLLYPMLSWHGTLQEKLFTPIICAYAAEFIFMQSSVQQENHRTNAQILSGITKKDDSLMLGIDSNKRRQILRAFKFPPSTNNKNFGFDAKRFFDINTLQRQINALDFFQKYVTTPSTLHKLLFHKRMAEQAYVRSLGNVDLCNFYLVVTKAAVGVARESSELSHIQQQYEFSLIQNLLSELNSRRLHVPDVKHTAPHRYLRRYF